MSICGFGHRQLLVRKFWYVELSFIFPIARIFPRWKTSVSSFNQFSLYRIAFFWSRVCCFLIGCTFQSKFLSISIERTQDSRQSTSKRNTPPLKSTELYGCVRSINLMRHQFVLSNDHALCLFVN